MFAWRREVTTKLDAILSLAKRILAMATTLDSLIASLNTNTTAVATRMDAILAQITKRQNAGSPPTQEQLDTLQAISDHLKQLGVDPSNPVPPAFPTGSLDALQSPVEASQPTPVSVSVSAPIATTDVGTAPIVTPAATDTTATPTS